jgi:hypothetical protein
MNIIPVTLTCKEQYRQGEQLTFMLHNMDKCIHIS